MSGGLEVPGLNDQQSSEHRASHLARASAAADRMEDGLAYLRTDPRRCGRSA